jgi:hypothetical protein
MWLIASEVARSKPELASLPFYQFGGFFSERLATCITHPSFTIFAVWGLQQRGVRTAVGILVAMVFHFAGNFPIYLMKTNAADLGPVTWQAIVWGWLFFIVIMSVISLAAMHVGLKQAFKFITSTQAQCPKCGEIYRQPILGANFGVWRYEPCTICNKWHWIGPNDLR